MNARLFIYHLIDIADEFDIKKLKKHLKKLRARPLGAKRVTPAYLNFSVPPLEMAGSAWSLSSKEAEKDFPKSKDKISGYAINTQFKFYSLGSVTIRYEVSLAGDSYEYIFKEAQKVINNPDFAEKTGHLSEKIRKTINKELKIKTYKGFFEDYNILWIKDKFSPQKIEDNKRAIAQFLRNENIILSESEQNEAYKHRFGYTAEDLTIIDWNRALTIGPESDDDVWDVLEYVNLQSLELRYYDSELDKRLDEIYRIVKRSHFSLLDFYLTPRLLKKTLRIFIDFAEVEDRINGFLKLTGDEYLARVYQAAAIRMNIKNTQAELKDRLIDARELYEVLAQNASSMRMEILETVVIILIAFEILYALVK